jgi:hypothetical protein
VFSGNGHRPRSSQARAWRASGRRQSRWQLLAVIAALAAAAAILVTAALSLVAVISGQW